MKSTIRIAAAGMIAALAIINVQAASSVIAQDEESSVVWGMPGATVAAGSCAGILPVGEIGARIARMLTGARS